MARRRSTLRTPVPSVFRNLVSTARRLDNPQLHLYPKESMTDRLYYHDSFLYNFDAEVRSVVETPRPALILDRTAFYPTSGGQIHDTGWLVAADQKLQVTEVADTEDGRVVHYFDAPLKDLQP